MSQSPIEIPETDGRTTELTPNERYQLLASEQRRLAMEAVADRTAPVELADLAAEVAEREVGTETTDGAVDRVAAALHHTHLPKMAEVGIVDYDGAANQIDPSG